jgi:hypothetical protein
MRETKFIALCFIVVMAFAGYASATTTYTEWTGTAGDGLWGTTGNWSTGVPLYTDSGGIAGNPNGKGGFKRGAAGVSPTFSSGTYGVDILVFGGAAGATTDLTIDGATLNISEYITLAANTNDDGQLTMKSGTINTGVNFNNVRFYMSQLGTGRLNMQGGTINVGLNYPTPAGTFGELWMSGTSGAGSGTLYLDGGVINASDLQKGNGTMSIIITDGVLLLKNAADLTGKIQGWIDDGVIRGGEGYEAVTELVGGVTKVYATPEPATMSLLGLGLLSILRRKK